MLFDEVSKTELISRRSEHLIVIPFSHLRYVSCSWVRGLVFVHLLVSSLSRSVCEIGVLAFNNHLAQLQPRGQAAMLRRAE